MNKVPDACVPKAAGAMTEHCQGIRAFRYRCGPHHCAGWNFDVSGEKRFAHIESGRTFLKREYGASQRPFACRPTLQPIGSKREIAISKVQSCAGAVAESACVPNDAPRRRSSVG